MFPSPRELGGNLATVPRTRVSRPPGKWRAGMLRQVAGSDTSPARYADCRQESAITEMEQRGEESTAFALATYGICRPEGLEGARLAGFDERDDVQRTHSSPDASAADG